MNTLLKGLFIFPLLLILGTSGGLAGDSEDAAFDLCIEQEEAKVVSYEGTKEWPAMRDAFLEKCGAFLPSADDEDYERGQADERAQIYKEHRQAVYDRGRASIRQSHNAKVENARRLAALERQQAEYNSLPIEERPGYQQTIRCTVTRAYPPPTPLSRIVDLDCPDAELTIRGERRDYKQAVKGQQWEVRIERIGCSAERFPGYTTCLSGDDWKILGTHLLQTDNSEYDSLPIEERPGYQRTIRCAVTGVGKWTGVNLDCPDMEFMITGEHRDYPQAAEGQQWEVRIARIGCSAELFPEHSCAEGAEWEVLSAHPLHGDGQTDNSKEYVRGTGLARPEPHPEPPLEPAHSHETPP